MNGSNNDTYGTKCFCGRDFKESKNLFSFAFYRYFVFVDKQVEIFYHFESGRNLTVTRCFFMNE